MAEFLKYLTDDDQRKLNQGSRHAVYEEDEVVLREGEERNALYFVRRGSVRVERTHLDFRYEISRLGPGEIFGEMSFVEGFVASANVVANGHLEVDIIAAGVVQQLAEADPGFSGRFYQSLAEILSQRLRETTVRSVSDFSWGGTDPAARNLTDGDYVPSDDDPWGAPSWDIDDDDP